MNAGTRIPDFDLQVAQIYQQGRKQTGENLNDISLDLTDLLFCDQHLPGLQAAVNRTTREQVLQTLCSSCLHVLQQAQQSVLTGSQLVNLDVLYYLSLLNQ